MLTTIDELPDKPDLVFCTLQVSRHLVGAKEGLPYIAHETTEMTGIKHADGTLSLARDEPGTGSAAYFVIVIGEQPSFDYGGSRNPDKQGFATFGRVVSGMYVVRNIHNVPADRFIQE